MLFADDDFFNIDILTEYARKMDLDYLAARDGEEAYQFFDGCPEGIDLILLDFHMPMMDGPDVCEKIRSKMKTNTKRCPIFLLSGMNKVSYEIAAKFDGVIYKPLTFDKLERTLLQHLHSKK